MKGYKRHDFYIRVKRAGEPSLEEHTGGYITVRKGITYACERQPVEGKELRWTVWHVLTGLRVTSQPLRTIQDVEDFLKDLDHRHIIMAVYRILEVARERGTQGFMDVYEAGGKTLGWKKTEEEFDLYDKVCGRPAERILL